jgi:hypothetical protein
MVKLNGWAKISGVSSVHARLFDEEDYRANE